MTNSYGTPLHSLRKQSTFHGATTRCLLTKWSLRNECRNSILMTCHDASLPRSDECVWLAKNVLQPISSTLRLIIAGSGLRYQNYRSAFNPRLSFNRSYHTDREPIGCTCTCRNIFTQHYSDHSFSFYLGTMEFVASLGNFAWLSSDYVSFILLLLNLITSTFHNQSKNRGQNSSY